MRILFVLLSISAAQAECLRENVTFRVPHGTWLSVASPGLASYHQLFHYGDTCIGKKHSRFTVKRIDGQLVTGDYQLVENDIAYYNECPNGAFVMTAEEAEKLCRAEAAADERKLVPTISSLTSSSGGHPPPRLTVHILWADPLPLAPAFLLALMPGAVALRP